MAIKKEQELMIIKDIAKKAVISKKTLQEIFTQWGAGTSEMTFIKRVKFLVKQGVLENKEPGMSWHVIPHEIDRMIDHMTIATESVGRLKNDIIYLKHRLKEAGL